MLIENSKKIFVCSAWSQNKLLKRIFAGAKDDAGNLSQMYIENNVASLTRSKPNSCVLKIHFVTVLSICLFFTSISFANDEIENNSEDVTLSTDEEGDDDLETQTADKGLSLSLGEAHPWEMVGINFLKKLNSKTTLLIFSGAGYFSQKASNFSGSDFEARAVFSTLGAEGRYFISSNFPLYISTSIAGHLVQGYVSPRASTVEDKTSSGRTFLSSRFQTQAVSASTGLGLSYVLFNRFFLDWNIISVKRAMASKIKIDDDFDDRSIAARYFVESTKFYGLFNLSFGTVF